MKKDINCSLLLDFYGNMLTEKQREVMKMYVDCDTSLSEIAEVLGSSRQAIYDIVKVASGALEEFEKKIGALSRYFENRELLLKSANCLKEYNKTAASKEVECAIENIDKVLKNQ